MPLPKERLAAEGRQLPPWNFPTSRGRETVAGMRFAGRNSSGSQDHLTASDLRSRSRSRARSSPSLLSPPVEEEEEESDEVNGTSSAAAAARRVSKKEVVPPPSPASSETAATAERRKVEHAMSTTMSTAEIRGGGGGGRGVGRRSISRSCSFGFFESRQNQREREREREEKLVFIFFFVRIDLNNKKMTSHPLSAPSAVGSDDGATESRSVATSRAAGSDGGRGEGSSWFSNPATVDGIVDGGIDEDGKQMPRRPSVPPLPLGKPEVAPSPATRRKNSLVAKLVASWQFAQRKRLRRQGKERITRFFLFCSSRQT